MIYLAAPLFSAAEVRFNKWLAQQLERYLDDKVVLPQETSQSEPLAIARECEQSAKSCDKCVAILDGPDVDSGVALEVGMRVALNMHVLGVRTDIRAGSSDDPSRGVNAMFRLVTDFFPSTLTEEADVKAVAQMLRK